MAPAPETCWTLCREAAEGDHEARDAFVERFQPAVRAYLGRRWHTGALTDEVEDAAREVFEDCFQDAVGPAPPGATSFRTHLLEGTRRVARRIEEFRAREYQQDDSDDLGAEALQVRERALGRVFDRAFAAELMREAAVKQKARAMMAGQESMRRVELLRLHFQHATPLVEIAARWKVELEDLEREFLAARADFRRALGAVVAFHHGGDDREVERECEHLLEVLES